MSASTRTKWHISGESVVTCNCAWGCPCQFNAPPTPGRCQALAVHEIRDGHFGSTSLTGLRFAQIVSWPGRIDQGNGTRLLVIDERGSKDQREAVGAMLAGKQGGAYFEIFAAVCPNTSAPVFKAIELRTDRRGRTAAVRIAAVAECVAEPIRNPVDGREHHARIVLPNGFEYVEAEMANAVRIFAQGGGELDFQYHDTYAQLNAFDWTNG